MRPVTRAELAERLSADETLKGMIGTDTDSIGFTDIEDCTEGQQAAINALANARILNDVKSEGGLKFDPTGTVPVMAVGTLIQRYKENTGFSFLPGATTRIEMLEAAYAMYQNSPASAVETDREYNDLDSCTEHEKAIISFFTTRGVVSGYSTGGFGPHDAVPNFQAAMFLYNCTIAFNEDATSQQSTADQTADGEGILESQVIHYALAYHENVEVVAQIKSKVETVLTYLADQGLNVTVCDSTPDNVVLADMVSA